jgi:predicted GIY-YIG superfamily endonuclease
MPDYKNGKIYQIWSPNTDKVYIGSTTQPLHKRFYEHKSKVTKPDHYRASCEVIKAGDAKIELIEEYPCENKMELERREGQISRTTQNVCYNKYHAGQTIEQKLHRRALAAAHRRRLKKELISSQDDPYSDTSHQSEDSEQT